MTVKELIEQLNQFPSDANVIVEGYEGGFDYAGTVKKQPIRINVNDIWIVGAHVAAGDGEPSDEIAILIA